MCHCENSLTRPLSRGDDIEICLCAIAKIVYQAIEPGDDQIIEHFFYFEGQQNLWIRNGQKFIATFILIIISELHFPGALLPACTGMVSTKSG